jgi:hypothetical protein
MGPTGIESTMRRKLLPFVLLGLGGMLTMGSLMEITVAIHPALLPSEAIAIPFMALHRTSSVLRAWILAANAVNLFCALTFLRTGAALWRARAKGRDWGRLRAAATVLATIAILGVPVCLAFLLPLPAGPHAIVAASRGLLLSIVAGAAGLTAVSLFLRRLAGSSLAVTKAAWKTPQHPGENREDTPVDDLRREKQLCEG